jgi:ubiquinone/menaquinone biosynthesis C-methylase UbiE
MGNKTACEPIKYNVGNSGRRIKISKDWLVLDLGSGHNPHNRANILVDRYIKENTDRSDKSIKIDHKKPFIIADAHFLPFKDKCFDYIIASHIAEHVTKPELFCKELMRIGKRGYIETPSKIGERILSEQFHKWYVIKKGSSLIFEKKDIAAPISILFYRFFYFDISRAGYVKLSTENKYKYKVYKFILNNIRTIWLAAKNLTYTCFEWQDSFKFLIK